LAEQILRFTQFCGDLHRLKMIGPHFFYYSAVLQRQCSHFFSLLSPCFRSHGKKIMQKTDENPFLHLIYYSSLQEKYPKSCCIMRGDLVY